MINANRMEEFFVAYDLISDFDKIIDVCEGFLISSVKLDTSNMGENEILYNFIKKVSSACEIEKISKDNIECLECGSHNNTFTVNLNDISFDDTPIVLDKGEIKLLFKESIKASGAKELTEEQYFFTALKKVVYQDIEYDVYDLDDETIKELPLLLTEDDVYEIQYKIDNFGYRILETNNCSDCKSNKTFNTFDLALVAITLMETYAKQF